MRRLSLALLAFASAAEMQPQIMPQPPINAPTLKAAAPTPLPPPFLVPEPASPTTTATTPAARALSAEMSAKISANGPKFAPPKPIDAKSEELPDRREIDKPRNGIIRLPQVMVQEQKVPVMKERELLTPEGKLDLAYKRNPGLRIGSLPFFSNNAIALAMLEEELRLERIAEATDMAGLYRYSDPGTGAAVNALAIPLFMRSSEWVEGAGGAGGGHALSKLK
ncbi:MAG: hypothetical protein ABIO94_10045 [Opitutaceae bacterium]